MIERYSRPQMKSLWGEESKYAFWALVEAAHLETLIELKHAPSQTLDLFWSVVKSKSGADFLAREQETNHDVIAFVSEIGDAMGESGSFLHRGLTSSDVLDTSLSLRVKKSLEITLDTLQKLRENLAHKAFMHFDTVCIGRTHGIHAEPVSFGQVLAGHFAEFQRAHVKILNAKKNMSIGKLSGAVGTYSQLSPEFERSVLKKLSLSPEDVATQIIPRDRILHVAQALLACSNAVERFAVNVRHLARTELAEVLEPFGKKQKGSSAMPHKKNPILAENLCGLARTVRGFFHMLSENSALWHERDISHSSVERVALQDIFITTDFMLARAGDLIEKMEVRPDVMEANLWKTGGLWASQSVLTALVSQGFNRTKAYELVQSIALQISEKVNLDRVEANEFLKKLLENQEVKSKVCEDTLSALFLPSRYLKSTSLTFKRVFGIEPEAFKRRACETLNVKVPALQRVVKITVELLADVLDTEAKAIGNDIHHEGIPMVEMRQQKSFLIRMPSGTSLEKIEKYAQEVLYNPVMEQIFVEVIQ